MVLLSRLDDVEQLVVRAFDGGLLPPVALLIAGGVGALHGLAPGHGKTLAGAYLVGARAGRRQAAGLACAVAALHTASVLVLGGVWWLAVDEGPIALGAVTAWGQLAVALVVCGVGIALLASRRPRHHAHGHDPASTDGRWSWLGAAGVASVAGLVPSPSAFLVLVSGLLTGRAVLAITMVVCFGLGLGAAVLGAGLAVLQSRSWLERRAMTLPRLQRLADRLPRLAALVAVAVGAILLLRAVSALLTPA